MSYRATALLPQVLPLWYACVLCVYRLYGPAIHSFVPPLHLCPYHGHGEGGGGGVTGNVPRPMPPLY
eukprot:COSAG01_NODE_11620_length_1893_cov_8.799331_1_plen_66_part_10